MKHLFKNCHKCTHKWYCWLIAGKKIDAVYDCKDFREDKK